MTLKFGKTDAAPRPSDFQLRSFVDVERVNASPLPYRPHDTGVTLHMYANGPDSTAPVGARNGVGCCVLAAKANLLQGWRHAAGQPIPLPLDGTTTVHAYSEVTGYVIGDDSTDRGTDMGVAAEWFRKTGMRDANGHRHKVAAWARFDPTDVAEMDAAIKLFGFAELGIQFPAYAMDEFDAHQAWTYKGKQNIEGGHCVVVPRARKVWTWARELGLGDTFVEKLADEGIVYVSPEFLEPYSDKSPEGYDQKALLALLAQVKS